MPLAVTTISAGTRTLPRASLPVAPARPLTMPNTHCQANAISASPQASTMRGGPLGHRKAEAYNPAGASGLPAAKTTSMLASPVWSVRTGIRTMMKPSASLTSMPVRLTASSLSPWIHTTSLRRVGRVVPMRVGRRRARFGPRTGSPQRLDARSRRESIVRLRQAAARSARITDKALKLRRHILDHGANLLARMW